MHPQAFLREHHRQRRVPRWLSLPYVVQPVPVAPLVLSLWHLATVGRHKPGGAVPKVAAETFKTVHCTSIQ